MYCTKCGKEISDGNRFCGFCGNPILPPPQKLVCSACGRELGAGMIFCSYCGTKADCAASGAESSYQAPPMPEADPEQDNPKQDNPKQDNPGQDNSEQDESSGEWLKMVRMSWCSGEYTSGRKLEATGKFTIYNDRVVYKVTDLYNTTALQSLRDVASFVFWPTLAVNLAYKTVKAKRYPELVLPMDQIASVRNIQDTAMLIEMKNGEKHTFIFGTLCLTISKGKRDECRQNDILMVRDCIKLIQSKLG